MRKYFYILITLLAVLSIGFVGCKNKPTAVSDFLDEPEAPASSKTPTPTKTLPDDINFVKYKGIYFESKKYVDKESGKEFKYTVEVIDWKYGSNPATVIEFKGYEKGVAFTRYYVGTQRNSEKKFALTKVSGDGASRADIQFKTTGYAYLKPSDYTFTIELAALKDKPTS